MEEAMTGLSEMETALHGIDGDSNRLPIAAENRLLFVNGTRAKIFHPNTWFDCFLWLCLVVSFVSTWRMGRFFFSSLYLVSFTTHSAKTNTNTMADNRTRKIVLSPRRVRVNVRPIGSERGGAHILCATIRPFLPSLDVSFTLFSSNSHFLSIPSVHVR